MRLLCLNQFVPPDSAPTAKLLSELEAMLTPLGWEVSFAGCSSTYHGRPVRGWRRWLRDAKAHLTLLRAGLFRRRPDCILCLSDPPGLVFTASLLARFWRVPLAHWAMDVYPEVAVALGEIRASGRLYSAVARAMRMGYARCGLIGCLDEDMAERLALANDPRVMLCAPWPPRDLSLSEGVQIRPESSRGRWMYSGNLGRAHDFETMLQAQKILEEKGAPYDLIIQGGGHAREEAMRLSTSLGLRHCHWQDYAPPEKLPSSLLEAHVLVASQRPEVRGLVWPSKLAVMRLLPRSILWIGPTDGAIAQALMAEVGAHGVFAPGDAAGVANWLLEQREALIQQASGPYDARMLNRNLADLASAGGRLWHARLMSLKRPDQDALPQPP